MDDKILAHIISVSGISVEHLETRRQVVKSFLQECKEKGEALGNAAYSLNTTSYENFHPHRLAVVGESYDEMLQGLETAVPHFVEGRPPNICFLYPGLGSQYPKMANTIYSTSSTFRCAVEQVQEALDKAKSLKAEEQDAGTNFEKVTMTGEKLLDPKYGLQTLTTNGYALQRLWEFWGIIPDCALGASVGEIPASIAAGILRMPTAIEMSERVYGLFEKAKGGMFALFMGENEVSALMKDFLKTCLLSADVWVDISLVNSPNQTVVSLSEKAIPLFAGYCSMKSIKYVKLPSAVAFHSRAIEPIIEESKELSKDMRHYRPRCSFVSSIDGAVLGQMDANYWPTMLRSRLNFNKACLTAYLEEGARVFLEIGAQPLLSDIMETNAATLPGYENDPIVCLPSLKKGESDWTVLMNSFAKLYLLGFNVNFHAVYAPYKELRKIQTPIKPYHKPTDCNDFWTHGSNDQKSVNKEAVRLKLKECLQKILAESGKDCLINDLEDKHFSQLGFSSLQRMFFKTQVQDLFKIQLRVSDFFDCLTLNQLEKVVCHVLEDTAKGNIRQSDTPEEMELTKQIILTDFNSLPEHIKRSTSLDKKVRAVRLAKIKTLFLAGGTGNMGPFFIQWLCKRKRTEKVYCLVRGENGFERLAKRFQKLDLDVDMSKIVVVKGNVYEERFGMEESEYEKLAWEVEAIVNSASCTSHLAKYKVEDFTANGPRAVNVFGTIRILEFACFNRVKWLYQASTGLASSTTKYMPYEKIPEEWPNEDQADLLCEFPLMGYPISKFISDHFVEQATRRGIPAKVFRFPKVGNCKDVSTNHFLNKFLHFLIAGQIPACDISLQIVSVTDCVNLSFQTFFNKNACLSDVYNVVSPYSISELDMNIIANELAPSLRFMIDVVRVNSVDFGPEPQEITERYKKLVPVLEMLDEKYGKSWVDSPDEVLQDEFVKNFLKQEYNKKMQFVDYLTFIQKAQEDGLRTPIFPWIEYYNSERAVYQRWFEKDFAMYIPVHMSDTVDFSSESLRHGKLECLWRDEIFDMITDPLTVVRQDIRYCIMNAKKLFSHPVSKD